MKIGTINIPQALLLAPMEDVSDVSFRLICKKFGADVMYTEFVNAEGLVRKVKRTREKMIFLEEERPFGIQIYGGMESSMEGAARMSEELQPDLIDINCGCWVRNIVGHGAGAGLLRDLPKMQRIVSSVVKAVKIPVTVKTRLGWDEKSIQIIDVAKMIEDTGAQALTVHCRTRSQGHDGNPDYTWIPRVKEAVKIPIIVNGGIESAEEAKRVFDSTGCNGIMIARGAIKSPWIFSEIKHYLITGKLPIPLTFAERMEILFNHLQLAVEYKGERTGVIGFRKFYSSYLREIPGASRLRISLMPFLEMQPIVDQLRRFMETYSTNSSVMKDEQLAA